MKDNLLMIFVFVILLTGFFSYAGYTGNYLFGSKNVYYTRDRNNYYTLSEVSGGYDESKTKISKQPTFTTTTLLQGNKGDVDCDGKVDGDDVISLENQYSRRRTLAGLFSSGVIAQLSSGLSTFRDKYVGSEICDLTRGDINDNGKIDRGDVMLLYYAVRSGGELESRFVEKDCNQEGRYVNVQGQICTCEEYTGSTVKIPYKFEKCVEPPSGYRAVQDGHGKVKMFQLVTNLEVS